AERSGHHAATEEQRSRCAREGELADPVHGEGEIALHHEDADETADDAEHGAGEDGVRQQRDQLTVVLEREDVAPVEHRGHHAKPPLPTEASSVSADASW